MKRAACAVFAAIVMGADMADAAPSSAGRLEFEVTRNGQPFGRHVVSVSQSGGQLVAATSVALRVGAGPVSLFRYEQTCRETWAEGELVGLACETLKEGRRTRVSAARDGAALRVTGAQGQTSFGPDALPTSWWSRPQPGLDYLIDTETGARMPVRITSVGRESIEVAGQRVAAEHLRVQGTLLVDLWYDMQGRWLGCAFTARGQRIAYRLTTPLAAAPA